MNRGDIYNVDLDPTKGHEQKGRRPVMVVSASAFNKASSMPIVVPITSGGTAARVNGFAVEIVGCLHTTGVALCDQPRVLALDKRQGVFVESAPQGLVDEVMARLLPIFS